MNTETNSTRSDGLKAGSWLLILLMFQAALWQSACGYVAAGAAGGVIGHEIGQERAQDDDDDDDADGED